MTALRKWYSTGQAARLLGRDPKTIRRWIYANKVPAHQIADGGEWRIPGWWIGEQLGAPDKPLAPRRVIVRDGVPGTSYRT